MKSWKQSINFLVIILVSLFGLFLGTFGIELFCTFVPSSLQPILILVLAIFAPFTLLIAYKPIIAIILLILAFPFQQYQFDLGFFFLSAYDTINYLLIISFLARTAYLKRSMKLDKPSKVLLYFMLYCALTIFFSDYPLIGLKIWISIGIPIIVYIIVNNSDFIRLKYKQVPNILLLLFIGSTFFALYQIFGYANIELTRGIYSGGMMMKEDRLGGGLFWDPNYLGSMLLAITFLILSCTQRERLKVRKILLLCLLPINGITLSLTFSRSVLASAALSLTVYFLLLLKKFGKAKTSINFLKVIFPTVLIGLLFSHVLLAYVDAIKLLTFRNIMLRFISLSNEVGVSNRVAFIIIAFKIFLENPITGVGFGEFGAAFPSSIIMFGHYVKEHRAAHNTYMRHLAETGIFGIVLYLLFLYFLFRFFFYTLDHVSKPEDKVLIIGIITSIFSMVLISSTLDYIIEPTFWFITTMSVMICKCFLRKAAESQQTYRTV